MTPNVLCLLFLLMTDVSLSAPAKNQDPIDESKDISEDIPTPKGDSGPYILQGDIAILNTTSKNADPCVKKGCKWPKQGYYVTVPYYISKKYSQEERNIILGGLESLELHTCIRFVPYSHEKDFIYFDSKDGCWSNLGRQGKVQYISLKRNGCLYHRIVQHEILHALGFNHEHVRSDRDNYVRIYTENIEPENEYNFRKVDTNNLGTPYDFTSVMHYEKYAFSKNGKPTIVAKADPNYDWGEASTMSLYDIARVNKLYECKYNALKRSAS